MIIEQPRELPVEVAKSPRALFGRVSDGTGGPHPPRARRARALDTDRLLTRAEEDDETQPRHRSASLRKMF